MIKKRSGFSENPNKKQKKKLFPFLSFSKYDRDSFFIIRYVS